VSLVAKILNIKKNRQTKLAGIKTRKQAIFVQAQRRLEQTQNSLREFSAALPQKEAKLFNSIKGKKVKKKHIEIMRQKVTKLHEKQREKSQEVENARTELVKAEQELTQATNDLNAAIREVEKLVEAQKIFDKQYLRQQERIQEKELEEFHSPQSAL